MTLQSGTTLDPVSLNVTATVQATSAGNLGAGTASDTYIALPVAPCGLTFIAPVSGKILVHYAAMTDSDLSTGFCLVSFRVGTGSTIGSGTQIIGPDDTRSLLTLGTNQARFGASYMVTGLTAGATYNADLRIRRSAGGLATATHCTLIVAATT